MKKCTLFILMLAVLFCFMSCDDDKDKIPNLVSCEIASSAHFGDSIPFSVTVDGNEPLNKIKALLYYGDVLVSETFIPANNPGKYSDKLFIPLLGNIPDGTAQIKFIIKNREFDFIASTVDINLTRPKYPYLILKTKSREYKMNPSSTNEHLYVANEVFPAQYMPALIVAPAYGEFGNEIGFGWVKENRVIKENQIDSIPFLSDAVGSYGISFNTLSYEGKPFVPPSFGGIPFSAPSNGLSIIENEFTQNQNIVIGGYPDLKDWWIDPTFLDKNGDGSFTLRAKNGKYRITADANLKYFRIEPMVGSTLAVFNPTTKDGTIWILGDAYVGNPSYARNNINWSESKGIAAAPLGNGIFQIKFIAGTTLRGSASGVNMKFFYQRGFGIEFTRDKISVVSDLFETPAADGNIRLKSGKTLVSGRKYVFTVNTSSLPATATVTEEN